MILGSYRGKSIRTRIFFVFMIVSISGKPKQKRPAEYCRKADCIAGLCGKPYYSNGRKYYDYFRK